MINCMKKTTTGNLCNDRLSLNIMGGYILFQCVHAGIGLTDTEEDYLRSAVSMPFSETALIAKTADELKGIADTVVEYMCEGNYKA